jgi:hypothetical protein
MWFSKMALRRSIRQSGNGENIRMQERPQRLHEALHNRGEAIHQRARGCAVGAG